MSMIEVLPAKDLQKKFESEEPDVLCDIFGFQTRHQAHLMSDLLASQLIEYLFAVDLRTHPEFQELIRAHKDLRDSFRDLDDPGKDLSEDSNQDHFWDLNNRVRVKSGKCSDYEVNQLRIGALFYGPDPKLAFAKWRIAQSGSFFVLSELCIKESVAGRVCLGDSSHLQTHFN